MLHRNEAKAPLIHRMYNERNGILDQWPRIVEPAQVYGDSHPPSRAAALEHRRSMPEPAAGFPIRRRLHRNNEENMSIHHEFQPEDFNTRQRDNSWDHPNYASPRNQMLIQESMDVPPVGFSGQVYSPQNPNRVYVFDPGY